MRPRARERAESTAGKRTAELRNAALALMRLFGGALQEIGRGALAAAEWIGRQELRVGRLVSRPVRAVVGGTRAAIRAGERAITPRRAVGVVVLCAAILLGVSQFVDYRGVGIGVPLYEDVEAVAPAPQTDRQTAGSAHSYVLLPVAALAIVALAFALRGRWQLGRAVALLGAVGVAITLLIDRPKGLDEGPSALAFEGADAILVEGFWVQLAASVVLVVAGLLLGRYVRAEQP
ncbi:MAG: hypothetical protein ACRDL3_04840, partial [Solirubrobacterales bacterium]